VRGSDDLGLSMISGSGGRLIVSLTEATRSENSRHSSVDRLGSEFSSYDPFKCSSPVTRVHDCSRFNFRLEAAFVAVPSITPPPMTRQVSWWGFVDALSESEVAPGLRGAGSWRTTLAGDPKVSPCGLVLVFEMILTFVLRCRLPRPRGRPSRYPKPRWTYGTGAK